MTAKDEPAGCPDDADADADPALARLAEAMTRRLQAGEACDVEALDGLDPAQAGPIRDLLPTLHDLAELGRRRARDHRRGSARARAAPGDRRPPPTPPPTRPGGCNDP